MSDQKIGNNFGENPEPGLIYGPAGEVTDVRTTDQKIRAAIKVECDRQHVGEDRQRFLYNTYMVHHTFHDMEMTDRRLQELACQIEPSNGGKFRTTPVSFNGIVGGVPPENIERAMENWIKWYNSGLLARLSLRETLIDVVIKEFLDIHPFSDGNGRTAWLLRVWMLNQWDDPQPLPDYYKEG